MNKTAITIATAAVILLGGFFLLRQKSYRQPASPSRQTTRENEAETSPKPQVEDESAEATRETQKELVIDSGNFFFKPNNLKTRSGKITVRINNNNGFHTFVIDELNVKEQLATGKTFTFNADPGTYEYYCDVPGHKEQGMLGTLKID